MFHVNVTFGGNFWVSIHPGADVLDRMPKRMVPMVPMEASLVRILIIVILLKGGRLRQIQWSSLYKKADLYETILSFEYVILLFCVHCSFR